MPRVLQGVLPVVQTPFTHVDQIDRDALKREVDWAYEQGADGIGTGMVSETLRLTGEERFTLASLLVEYTAGRGAVYASVGAESGKQAVLYANQAEHVGCDAVMAVPPLTSRLPEDALIDYFRTIAEGCSLPLLVQDASGYVGQAIPLKVCVTLFERYGPDKILFKPEAAPIGPNLSLLKHATHGRARIFEGSGGILLIDSYRRGIAGTIPGTDVLDGIVALWRALKAGDDETAYRVYFPICALVALQMQAGLDGFLAIEKYLLMKRGILPSDRRRMPYTWTLDNETRTEVDRLFALLQAALAK